ncbi:MAG: DEAD/DEAH box helicase, partial [Planctomycetes bacterium]|nr:DEAD/DEAH box helicase [Planctomycetota bacterium]
QVPLEGVADTARRMGQPLPALQVAVRTGHTSTRERQRQLRRPPHVLITTPESLHLLLTSRGRDTLRGVTHCIVDEIHALCGNKRGVFLSLLLERLAALQAPDHSGAPSSFVRIGLSATQRPLDEVARFLGGCQVERRPDTPVGQLQPRPVSLVDAGLRKDLDLRVISPVEHFGPLPEKSVWPSIYRLLQEQIRAHRSTLIFANNRRAVERITAFLNEDEEIARAHHGSVALEVRQETEQALKEGRLPAVVATASLEMGIDMGAIDLVCQVESPGNVARGLQRVGRAGHLVGQKSKGRLIPKMPNDLLEQAVLAREMAAGRVEEVRVPTNCLDVLAQQVVAMVAMEAWTVPELFALVRRASPYRDLSPQAFESVLEMVSGRFVGRRPSASGGCEPPGEALPGGSHPPLASVMEALQPRVSWDRVHNRLHALPGSQQMALVNGGTIPDTGQYAAYTTSGVRIGELDEEFIYERRIGDAFLLGTNAWRLLQIEADRVLVAPAEGAPAMVPFWRGENTGRSHDLGLAVGGFLRELAERIDQPNCLAWLERDYFLERRAAHDLRHHVLRQLDGSGALPTDRTVVVEASRDQLGDWQVILLSPFGSRLHLGLRLALEARLSQRLGYRPQCLHHDDGILVRLTDCDEPILDILEGLTPENVETLILDELAESALFALRFRQNAARSLMLPRGKPGQRAPLWLQRLRGRDLLQVARRHPDFPVVVETFRECLHDHLDVPRLQELLRGIQAGAVEVRAVRREVPSPFAAGLVFSFTAAFMYQYDGVEANREGASRLDQDLLRQLLEPEQHRHLLDPRAVYQVERRLRGLGQPPRSLAEMAEWLRRLGDLAPSELEGPMAGFLEQLQAEGRATVLELPRCRESQRWVLTEAEALYRCAFGLNPASGGREPPDSCYHQGAHAPRSPEQDAAEIILARFLDTHALVSLDDVLERYPFERAWAEGRLQAWATSGRAVPVRPAGEGETMQWSAPANLEQVQRGSLGLLRREVLTCPAPQFADFLLRWQGAHPDSRKGTSEGLAQALARLQGLPLPADLWEQTVLPVRVPAYQPRWLDEWVAGGAGAWLAQGDLGGSGVVAFLDREELLELSPPATEEAPLSDNAQAVLEALRQRGASFVPDLAQATERSPSSVRAGLWELAARTLVTNDHFDVVRNGRAGGVNPPVDQTTGGLTPPARPRMRLPRPSLVALRRRAVQRPEGRWSALPWGGLASPETQAVLMAARLLNRYGVVARELALLDPWMPPWRVLYEVLTRMELAGEVRRGYFVEGPSGAQFALPDAARLLQDTQSPSTATAPVLLLHSLDPANLYGSGAPLDVPLLDGGSRSFVRRSGNWLVLRAGRPVLLIEQQGRRLTALPSASRDDVAAAVGCLPSLCDGKRNPRHRLTVDEWNGRPVTATEGGALLEAAGFVRDYQGMTLYAVWR